MAVHDEAISELHWVVTSGIVRIACTSAIILHLFVSIELSFILLTYCNRNVAWMIFDSMGVMITWDDGGIDVTIPVTSLTIVHSTCLA